MSTESATNREEVGEGHFWWHQRVRVLGLVPGARMFCRVTIGIGYESPGLLTGPQGPVL